MESNLPKRNYGSELLETFKSPWSSSAFNLYFFGIVVLLGGAGIIISVCQELKSNVPHYTNISEAISTTSVAIIAASLVDVNLSLDFKNQASLLISTVIMLAVSGVILFLTYHINNCWSFIPSTIGYIVSLIVWVLANAYNDKLNDTTYQQKVLKKVNNLGKNWTE